MAKIGTAQIEIKPVLDEAALTAITDRIATAVRAGVQRGMAGTCPDCGGCGYVNRHFVGIDGSGYRSERCPSGCPAPLLRNGE